MTFQMQIDDEAHAHIFSRCAVKLTLFFGEIELAFGSGVIAEDSAGPVLITAAHNFTGRHPDTKSALANHGGLPNIVGVEGCRASFRANLYLGTNSPIEDIPRYATHPQSTLDVAVLRLKSIGYFVNLLNVSSLDSQVPQVPLYVSQLCHIIGFPLGLEHRPANGILFPIWKTGHIASEPNSDFNGFPKLLVDATPRRGMSGALVVVKQNYRYRLVGIYTGRFKQPRGRSIEPAAADEIADDFTAELGWVTKRDAFGTVIAAARQ